MAPKAAQVAPEDGDDGGVGSAKQRGKSKKKKDEKKEHARPTSNNPYGEPDDYPEDELPIKYSTIMEYSARANPANTMAIFSEGLQALLPREQIMMLQQMIFFDQMIGRLMRTSCQYPNIRNYDELVEQILEGAKAILKMKKARLYGVDFNSLGQPRSCGWSEARRATWASRSR